MFTERFVCFSAFSFAILSAGTLGCSSAPADDVADVPSATTEQGDDEDAVGQVSQAASQCLTYRTITCGGGQPSSVSSFNSVCNNVCASRGLPSCTHTWYSCGYGYGGQCRCRVNHGGQ